MSRPHTRAESWAQARRRAARRDALQRAIGVVAGMAIAWLAHGVVIPGIA